MTDSLTGEDARRELYSIMSDDTDVSVKADKALSLGVEYLSVENGHLTEINEENDHWKALYSTDTAEEQFPPGLILELGNTYCRRTITEGPITLHDAGEQGWADDPAYQTHELPTYHGTALMVDDEPYGTVCFVSTDKRDTPFSEDETMFAELITRMLEHEITQKQTQETVERLEQFASIVSHDLRNPLNTAQGNIELATEEYGHPDTLQTAMRSLDRMEELIGDVLALARQSQSVDETNPMSLSTLTSNCWGVIDTANAEVEIASNCKFMGNQQRVKQLFENIFRNAIEHGGNDITVRVGSLDDRDGFYIENSGEPIPEDKQDEIFETGVSNSGNGLGLGLAIVKGVVTSHGWDITVTDSDLDGPRFEITNIEPI